MKLKRILKNILKWSSLAILLALFVGIILLFIAYWRSTNDCGHNTAAPGNSMKAIVYCDYGLANLKLENVERPTPTDDQVLVRVRAASVNPYDWHFVEGTPKIMRAMGVGLRKPKVNAQSCVLGFAQPDAHCAHDLPRAFDEMPVIRIHRSPANSDQDLIIGWSRLLNLLQLQIS